MKYSLIFLYILFVLTGPAYASEHKPFDIYLLIGQSNMAGRGEFEQDDTIAPIDGVWLLDSAGIIVPATPPLNRFSSIRKDISLQGYNPGIEFSRLMHGRTGRPILLVVNARGGSHIRQWQPGASTGYFDEAVRRTRQALKYGNIKAILWHQGETDIQKHTSDYPSLFSIMISKLKKELGAGDLPVILGQVGQWNWADRNDIDRFNDSILPATVGIVPNSDYVSSDALKRRYKDKEHDPHFGREAQRQLGRRYADALTPMTENVYIARFRDDKPSAVSFTFDDGDEDHALLVAPELAKRGFRGTFWIIGDKIDKGDSVRPRVTWQQLREMVNRGHEVSNHSFTHGKLVRMDSLQVEREIQMNDSAILHNTGIRPTTFCYPFNATTPMLKKIANRGRVGTRMFQVGMGQANNKSTAESLRRWLDGVLDRGDWGVTMIHGITKGYDKWSDPELLWGLFDRVKSHKDSIWVDTFREISAYQEERDNTVVRVFPTKDGMKITTECSLDSTLFNVPLTVVVKGDWTRRHVTAAKGKEKRPVDTEVCGNRLLVSVLPTETIYISLKER